MTSIRTGTFLEYGSLVIILQSENLVKMGVHELNTKQQKALFFSLRDQYKNSRPMTEAEESNMWSLQGILWRKNGGKAFIGYKCERNKGITIT